MLNEVVIVSAVRTPLGCFMGALSNFSAVELGIRALNGAVKKINPVSYTHLRAHET